MDYQSTLSKYLFIFLFIFVVSGCDRKISQEPLTISGTPPSTIYYDSLFEYEFGASGGDGNYRYRYIQHPESDDENNEYADNPFEMSIEVTDSAKPSFKLSVVPKLPAELSIESIGNQKFKYALELTDGKNTVTREFEFTLKANQLNIVNASIFNEGTVNSQIAEAMLNQRQSGQVDVCKQIKDRTYEKYTSASGEVVYPFVFQVTTDAPVASKTEFFYRIVSGYSEGTGERSAQNISHARKNVDYLNSIHSIVLEPQESRCIGYVEMLDDSLFEAEESFTVEFFNTIGGAVDISSAEVILNIRDNEITPQYETKNVVRNRGAKITVPMILSKTFTYPVSINISVDTENTTADDSDYLIEPVDRVVMFNPGEVQSSYSVTLLPSTSTQGDFPFKDKIISIQTDIDEIKEVDPYTIEINEWLNTESSSLDYEILASSNISESVIDFVVDGQGIVTTLIKVDDGLGVRTKLKSFNKDASNYKFSSEGTIELSKIGLDVIPKMIVSEANSAFDRLAVILNVNGLYGDVFRGGDDFIVMSFQKHIDDDFFTLISTKQYGTEGNDIVTGAKLQNNTLFVYGRTNGLDFEGSPTAETNNGGYDGFLYSIDITSNSYKWARFMGTSDSDDLVSIDIGNRDIVSFVSTQNSDEDAYIRKFFLNTGLDQTEENPIIIQTLKDDKPIAVKFDASASTFNILMDSDSQLDLEGELTSSLTRDVQLLSFDSDNLMGGTLSISTSQDDLAKSLEAIPSKEHIIVSGNTFGKFEDNTKKGVSGSDAFTSIVNIENSGSFQLEHLLQFGTPGNDEVISVKAVSDTKFFVLWSEDYSETNHTVYRISPFSIDGQKLSRDPL